MGITDFRKIKETYFTALSLSDLKQSIPKNIDINVYVDGPYYLFSGYTQQNLDQENETFVASHVVDTAAAVIYNKITFIKKTFLHNKIKVFVFFDGLSPKNKQLTSNKRRLNQKNNLKYKECQNLLINILNEHEYTIYNLIIGEAEHEMIMHRICNNPSIIMTDDSDIFHIAYKLETVTSNDKIYSISKDNTVYDLVNLNIGNMPKLCFTLLCHMKGSDYFPTIITTTMMMSAIDAFLNYKKQTPFIKTLINDVNNMVKPSIETAKNSNIRKNNMLFYNNVHTETYISVENIYTPMEIAMCMKKLLLIITNNNQTTAYWCKQTKGDPYNTAIRILSIINLLTWAVNYSFIGSCYDLYTTEILPPDTINPYILYKFLLNLNENDNLNVKLTDFIKNINSHVNNLNITVIKKEYKNYSYKYEPTSKKAKTMAFL